MMTAPIKEENTSMILIQLYFSDLSMQIEKRNTKIIDVFARIVLLEMSVKFKLRL